MTHSVIETLDWLIEYWPDLVDARLPLATRRLGQQPHLTGEAAEQRDFEARIDWHFRNPLALGESPAPVDVSVLQTALDILVAADDLAAELAASTMCPPLPPPALGQLDARPWLRFAAARLAEGHPGLARWAEPPVWHMYSQVARALCLLYDGQIVKVVCPWCKGLSPETPAGGAYTWRVVIMPGDQIAIRCQGLCNPPPKSVGTWWGGQPCWPLTQWLWLAKQVHRAERISERHKTR